MSKTKEKARPAKIADALPVQCQTAFEALLKVEADNEAASREPVKTLVTHLLPILPRDANGRWAEKGDKGWNRKALDAYLIDMQKKSSRYTETFRLVTSQHGHKQFIPEAELLANDGKDVDKLDAFTVTAAIAFNDAKIKYTPAQRVVIDDKVDTMAGARRQILFKVRKAANKGLKSKGANKVKDGSAAVKAKVDAHTKTRKDNGHKVDANMVKAGWAMIRKGWGYTK